MDVEIHEQNYYLYMYSSIWMASIELYSEWERLIAKVDVLAAHNTCTQTSYNNLGIPYSHRK